MIEWDGRRLLGLLTRDAENQLRWLDLVIVGYVSQAR